MFNLNTKIYNLPVYTWLLIVAMIYVFYLTFSNSKMISSNSNKQELFSNKDDKEDKKIKVYNFNTSWCGWSVRFKPEWEKFADEVKAKGDLSNVEAYDIKCDNPENDFMCKEYEIVGFPTVIIEANGQKGIYKGPREAKDLIETIKEL